MSVLIIGICTYKRPNMLSIALDGVTRLSFPENYTVKILIVDNDAQGSAQPVVQSFAKRTKHPVHYHVEENAGLVNARNRLLKEAYELKGDWLAGFDDDDIPDRNWLIGLVNAQHAFNAQAVHGPRFLHQPVDHSWIQHKKKKRAEGKKLKFFSTANYLVDLSYLKEKNIWFDPQFNFTGAEDSDLSHRMYKSGAVIVWTNNSILHEIARDDRTALKSVVKRAFDRGCSSVLLHRKHDSSHMHLIYHVMVRFVRRLFVWPFSLLFGKKAFARITVSLAASIGELFCLLGGKRQLYSKSDGS